jgi:cation diffusion facilitator family transporter
VGVFAKSQGLISDGIHSLSDLVADFVVLFASHHGKKEADEAHPYGHQRFETAASLLLGVLLLTVGVGMLCSAFRKLEDHGAVQQVHVVALYVAAGALVAKKLLFRYMLSVAKRVKSSTRWPMPGMRGPVLIVRRGQLGAGEGTVLIRWPSPPARSLIGIKAAATHCLKDGLCGRRSAGVGWSMTAQDSAPAFKRALNKFE